MMKAFCKSVCIC